MALEDKHRDLKSTQQRKVVESVMAKLAKTHPDFYYLPAIELAAEIQRYVREPGNLSQTEKDLVGHLKRRDIQLILGLHSQAD